MANQSSGADQLSVQWSEVNEKVQKGEKLIKQAQKMIETARKNMWEDNVTEGVRLVESGKREIEQSERIYKGRCPSANEQKQQNL